MIDVERAAQDYIKNHDYPGAKIRTSAFKAGANFVLSNTWKDAQGDVLPELEKEVIALVTHYDGYKVVYAHRPNPDGWDGENIDTGEVTHYKPKCYDKGGWNQPDVRWWLDVDLPE